MTSPGAAVVTCVPSGRVLRPREGESLLEAALREGQPLASSCGGRAVCGDCLVRVVTGAGHLTPAETDERAWRKRSARDDPGRLACTVRVTGPVEITTTYW